MCQLRGAADHPDRQWRAEAAHLNLMRREVAERYLATVPTTSETASWQRYSLVTA